MASQPDGTADMQTSRVTDPDGGEREDAELDRLVSVFLTPDVETPDDLAGNVRDVARGQRLDGVLRFEPDLVVVIESKVLERRAAWQSVQLDLGGVRPRHARSVHLAWSRLLDAWQRLADHGLLAHGERWLVQDLLDYAERHFPQVLPFATLRQTGEDAGRGWRRLRTLLSEATGLQPEDQAQVHVRLDQHLGTVSLQRAALGDEEGLLALHVWPGELAPQARHLYEAGSAERLLSLTRESGFEVRPEPHLAFHTARARDRLHLHPRISVDEYVRRWSGEDRGRWGNQRADTIETMLWPWLLQRGYASPEDSERLPGFLSHLGRRPAHLRAGLRVSRRWRWQGAVALDEHHELAPAIRTALSEILALLDDVTLPEPANTEVAAAS